VPPSKAFLLPPENGRIDQGSLAIFSWPSAQPEHHFDANFEPDYLFTLPITGAGCLSTQVLAYCIDECFLAKLLGSFHEQRPGFDLQTPVSCLLHNLKKDVASCKRVDLRQYDEAQPGGVAITIRRKWG